MRTLSVAQAAAWYVLILIGIYGTFWLLVETEVVKFNKAVTIGEIDGKETYFSFDPSNTTSRDGYVLMDTTLSFRKPQPNPTDPARPYKSIKTLTAYDCRNRAMGPVRVSFYSEELAKGEVVWKDEEPTPLNEVEFVSAAPASGRARLLNIVCSDISRTRIWWAVFKAAIVGGSPDIPGL